MFAEVHVDADIFICECNIEMKREAVLYFRIMFYSNLHNNYVVYMKYQNNMII